MRVQQPDDVKALLAGDQRAPVALHVADLDQPLDDRRASGRRADARVLHRLAQLVVVDELARRLHRSQQRRVAVAARRFGFLAQALDLARLHLLVLVESRQLLVVVLVLLACGLRVGGHLVVDAAPAGHQQEPSTGAEHERVASAILGPLASPGRGSTVVSTRVFSNTASGWNTARKRRAAMS